MRLDDVKASTNVDDRRRSGIPGGPVVGGGLGVLVIGVLALLLTGDPSALLGGLLGGGGPGGGAGPRPGTTQPRELTPAEVKAGEDVAKILTTTEEVWGTLLAAQTGVRYVAPKLVLFSQVVQSGCGRATAQVGPFYCPADQQVYIDLSFYDDLSRRFGAPGDFAQAYVIAHEVGHHVQNLLGTSDRVHAARGRVSDVEQNRLSVRLELQADFYAGVWAHHANKRRPILEEGDVDEAIRCAKAIGDDRLQSQAGRAVVPDSFTHGTSEQRAAWFKHGLRTGDLRLGDTFDDEVFHRVSPR
jgi:predicted metalloprotease